MRIAVLSDIHGNWEALRRISKALSDDSVDVVLGLGDYLNTSTGTPHVVRWMKSLDHAYFVRGNGDSWEYHERFKPLCRFDLRKEYSFVTCLPDRMILDFDGFVILLQHSWHRSIDVRNTSDHDEIRSVMTFEHISRVTDLTGIDMACFGDLHLPFLDAGGDTLIAHPGSVGAPIDSKPWMAKFLLLEVLAEKVNVRLRSVSFTRRLAVNEMWDAVTDRVDGPHWLERALFKGDARRLGWHTWCMATERAEFDRKRRHWSIQTSREAMDIKRAKQADG